MLFMTTTTSSAPLAPATGAALRTASVYLLIGFLWIGISDRLVQWVSDDPRWVQTAQTYKGFVFVLVTAALFGLHLRRMLRRWEAQAVSAAAMDEALRASHRELVELKVAIDEHAIVVVCDAAGRILSANDKYCAITGYAREEVVGQDNRLVNSGYHTKEFMQGLWETILAGKPWHGEVQNRAKNGLTYWVQSTIVPVRGEDGKPRRFIGIQMDITGRKQMEAALRESEERFREVVESIQEVVWMTDVAKTQMFYISPRYAEIWGRPVESVYAQPFSWVEAVHEEDRARVAKAAKEQQALGTYDETFRIVRPDGSERWVRDRAFPIRSSSGQVFRIAGVAEDVTEQRALEEKFFRAQRLEAIGTLASGVAHDLNNVLAPVLMACGLLRVQVSEPRPLGHVALIEQSVQRGARLIGQLLTFGRGSGGKRVAVPVRHLLKEVQELIRETFPRNIRIEVEVPTDLWVVMADPTQLHQVFMNLCVNARDAMPEGGELSLTASNVSAAATLGSGIAGPHVLIVIKDTGTGIPVAIRGKIFDPFFTTKPLGKGTGLGLASALGIVRHHGGTLSVYSEPGKGTSFHVRLPASPEAQVAAEAPAAPVQAGQGELVLVVDDEEAIRTACRSLLETTGYRVLTADHGDAALSALLAHPDVDVMLTDMMMPGMPGEALIRAVRTVRPGLPILATSGLDTAARRQALEQLGVEEFLPKPVTPAALLGALRRGLKSGGAADPRI